MTQKYIILILRSTQHNCSNKFIKKNSLEDSIIMFPFNTDGIDPSGGRMHIYNLTFQNYDDIEIPKHFHDDDCTRDMLIENCEVY